MRMVRYYAIATVIVAVAIAIAAAWPRAAGAPDERTRYGTRIATPSPPRHELAEAGTDAGAFVGAAPWALSALPDCYRQLSAVRAAAAIVARDAPPVAVPLSPGSSLTTGTCTVHVEPGALVVDRGEDRLRVPGVTRLYLARDARHGEVLVLERHGDGLPEVRRYGLRVSSELRADTTEAAVSASH